MEDRKLKPPGILEVESSRFSVDYVFRVGIVWLDSSDFRMNGRFLVAPIMMR